MIQRVKEFIYKLRKDYSALNDAQTHTHTQLTPLLTT